mgnify:CR=1 FL=1
MLCPLIKLKGSYRINPAGEGGEIESFVINAPLFNSGLEIIKSKIHYSNYSGRLEEVFGKENCYDKSKKYDS